METAFVVWMSLSAGNFVYEILFLKMQFGRAVERSFFEGIAIAGLIFAQQFLQIFP